jgi:hypothetical protein
MGRFHLASAAILARVAGFGKNVVPFFRLWIWGGCAAFAYCDLENRSPSCIPGFGYGCFHNFRLLLADWEFGLVW